MSATPGARSEYSRGSSGSSGPSGPSGDGSAGGSRGAGRRVARAREPGRGLVRAGALLGALLLVVAEFTTLYREHVAGGTVIGTVSTGSPHAYAMIPIALLGAFLGYAVWRAGSRSALVLLGAVGAVALLIGLLGDLPDARAHGIRRTATGNYVQASDTPSAGLYMETLGAVILIATCGSGLLALGVRANRAD